MLEKQKKAILKRVWLEEEVSVDLFSRAAARQVFSALKSLTTVFGMGTGVPSASSTPTSLSLHLFSKFVNSFFKKIFLIYFLNKIFLKNALFYIKMIFLKMFATI